MSNQEWKTYKLGDVVEVKHGFAFKGESFSTNPTIDILLTPGNFKIGGGFKDDKFKYYKGAYPKEYVLNEGDVIVTMTDLSKEGDTLGYSAKVPTSEGRNFLHNQRIGLLKFKSDELDKDWIYWLLRTKEYQSFIANSATGTTVRHTSPTRIREYEFYAPPKSTQQKIASILSSLDDKIELNRQTNTTLEAIAQALFKEWFVAFNFPGASGELVDSELGMVPVGWRVGVVGDLFELQRGFDLPTSTRTDGLYPVFAASGLNGYHNHYKIKAPGITTGRSGVLGNVFYVQEDFWPLNTSLFIKDFKLATPLFAFHVLQTLDLKNLNGGSAVPTLNRNEVHKLNTVLPSAEPIKAFEMLVAPIFQTIHTNEQQTQTLTHLRDHLLPRLMKGQ